MGTQSDPGAAPPRPNNLFALVRLRLALALVAAALAPLVIVSVILPTLLGGGRDEDRQRIQGQTMAVSAALAGEIERIHSALLLVAADRSMADLVAHGTGAAVASPKFTALAPLLDGELVGAKVVTRKGTTWPIGTTGKFGAARQATAAEARLLSLTPAGDPSAVAVTSGESGKSGPIVTMTAPAGGGTTASGSVAAGATAIVEFDVSMSAVLARVGSTTDAGSGYVQVVDSATGDVVGDSRGITAPVAQSMPDLSSVVGGIVQRADRAWTSLVNGSWAVGMSPVTGLPSGGPSWAVVVVRPAAPASTPLGLLGALSLLTIALVALAAWMSAQVLRPARELEASQDELRQLYEVARNEALLDPLTGIGNHRAFTEEFDRQLEITRRHGLPIALLLLDLDDFKGVNDRDGHPAGDRLLAGFASLLRGTVRATDRVFRLGGDEFAVVMPTTDSEGAEAVARRLLGRSLNAAAGGDLAPVSFSAGISAAPEHGLLRAELYAGADAALYWSKRHGRTSVEVFDPGRHRVNPSLAGELAGVVLDVIKHRDLKVLFQPIVGLEHGEVLGYEALTRPVDGSSFADAGSFFNAAQQSGRILEVDVACLDLVTAAAAAIVPAESTISINLSPVTLEAAEFSANRLRRLLERHGLAPERIIVEITEREPIDDLGRVQANVEALRQLGVRVAADDVGAGNSGLQLLSKVRFDIVKIDISLVHDAVERRQSFEVMRSIVAIARNWGATVIAEGIETEHQLAVARSLGVEAGQGYLLGRPAERCDPTPVDLGQQHARLEPAPRHAALPVPLAPTA